eukprot:426431-Hanusia_phi.AAC.3
MQPVHTATSCLPQNCDSLRAHALDHVDHNKRAIAQALQEDQGGSKQETPRPVLTTADETSLQKSTCPGESMTLIRKGWLPLASASASWAGTYLQERIMACSPGVELYFNEMELIFIVIPLSCSSSRLPLLSAPWSGVLGGPVHEAKFAGQPLRYDAVGSDKTDENKAFRTRKVVDEELTCLSEMSCHGRHAP